MTRVIFKDKIICQRKKLHSCPDIRMISYNFSVGCQMNFAKAIVSVRRVEERLNQCACTHVKHGVERGVD